MQPLVKEDVAIVTDFRPAAAELEMPAEGSEFDTIRGLMVGLPLGLVAWAMMFLAWWLIGR